MTESTVQKAYDQLMGIAGTPSDSDVSFEVGARALETRFYAEECAAAALAAGAIQAADIGQLRGGSRQEVSVSTRKAAASLISVLHQRFEDPDLAPRAFDPLAPGPAASGFFATHDERHVYLHPSFPDSIPGHWSLLGCENTKESVTETVGQWTAKDLEDAIASAGICGAMVRTADEWDRSEQGQILEARPVVEVTKIGESDPMAFDPAGERLLSGCRVLDFTRVLAGPTCARTLAQYGAEVLRISSPHLPSLTPFVADTGHGKRSAHLDLRTDRDRQGLNRLIASCDVFSQGYRTGSLDRMGYGPLQLAALKPGIVYTSINCYGHEGAWRGRPGWEQLAQTVTGMADVQGGESGPALLPCAATDYTTGYLAAFGSLIALKRRALFGGSYLVRVSLTQTGMWIRQQGLQDMESLPQIEPLTASEISSMSTRSETGFGPMTHLSPSVRMSRSDVLWHQPVVPLGTHEPSWT